MADHAVGGVDRFVEAAPGRPAMASQNTGATTPSEKFSARLSIAARATPACIERVGIAADDWATAARPPARPSLFQRVGDIGDMPVQAALRDQGAGDDGDGEQSERQAEQFVFDNERDRADNAKEEQDRDDADGVSPRRSVAAVSRLSKRSSAAIRRPIQVTGWPIARNSACG